MPTDYELLEDGVKKLIRESIGDSFTVYTAARAMRNIADELMASEKTKRVEELRVAATYGREAEAELATLGVPLKPRAPRADKGTKRKPKEKAEVVQ